MKKKIVLALVTVVLLLSIVLNGCASGGVAQEKYDQAVAQLADAQSQLTKALNDLSALQDEKDQLDFIYQDTVGQLSGVTQQYYDLKAQYEFVGLTTAEVAEKIVQNYHATHVYSTFDMFICGDMSAEVWNMLKAQGISARVVVGNIDAQITGILQSDHAWVLAEVAPGEYLALETTAGYVVARTENQLYYRGWYFDSPADLKSNNDLIKEYNLRVEFRNLLANEVNNAQTLYNNSSTQAEADKWLALYTKLKELKDAQEALLTTLMNQINQLATQL